jgi:putative glutamine amidotransferase
MKIFIRFLILFFCILIALSPAISQQTKQIAVSKLSENYRKWLLKADSTIVIHNLYLLKIDSALRVLNACSGLLLTGGEDVYPAYYQQVNDTSRCTEMNLRRDSLEMALIQAAIHQKKPILGICRGSQLLNVFSGEKLIVDIPTDFPSAITHQMDDYEKCFHSIKILPNTLLSEICQCDSGIVNSNHHQAVKRTAKLLSLNCFTSDGLIEGIEYNSFNEKPFLLGVQWHPERLDFLNPLSGPIAQAFLNACRIVRIDF